jgi:predicted DCC family thiol-disulfide oxidoreductase YuxK
MDRWTLIYDGDCQFCRRQVDRLRKIEKRGLVQATPFQTADLARFGIELRAAEEAMHLVAPSGTVWRGAEATRELLRLLPFGRPLVWLLRAPGAMFAAERVYRWLARRRHRFGCDSSVCRRGSVGG